MARIPLGNFGQGATTAPVVHTTVGGGDDPVGKAVARLAESGMQISANAQAEQDRLVQKELQQRQSMARVRATNALLDHEIQTKTGIEDVRNRMLSGDLDWREAEGEAKQVLGKIAVPEVPDLDPIDGERMQGGIRRNLEAARVDLAGTVKVAQRQEQKAEVMTSFDSLDKLAGLPDADIDLLIKRAGAMADRWQAAGLDPSQFEKTRQGYVDKWWTQHASRREMLARDNPAALEVLANDLTRDDGFYAARLDSNQRNVLLNRVLGAQGRLEQRAEVESNRRNAAAGRAIEQYERQIATGVPAPVEVMFGWGNTVAGTSYEAEFQQIQRSEIEVQQVMLLSPVDQRTYLQQLKAKQQAEGATVAEQQRAGRLEKAIELRLTTLRESPLEFYGNTTGQAVRALDLNLLQSGALENLQAQIGERMTVLDMLRRQYGSEAGSAPLLPQEASALAGVLTKAKPTDATRLFGHLNQAFADPQAYLLAMKQIAPDSPVRAEAGRIYALQRPLGAPAGPITAASPAGQYGDVALTILRGEALLNPDKASAGVDAKPVKMPPPQDVQRVIASQLRNAFAGRPEELQVALDSASAYYAAKTADAGDLSGQLNSTRLKEALRAVVGERTEFHGRDVIPPWGMSAASFRDIADTYVDARLKAAGRKDPGDVALVNLRGHPGYYGLVRGIEPVYDNNDPPQPLVIRIGGNP